MNALEIARNVVNNRRTRRLEKLNNEPSVQRVPGGFQMRIDPQESNDRQYYLGVYERAVTEVASRLIRPGDTCLDIGANKGYFTLLFAKLVGKMGMVVSADPDPNIVPELKANVKLNEFNWVRLRECAIGDTMGHCEFVLNSVIGNSSRFPNDFALQSVSGKITVPEETADSILGTLSDSRPVSFVKIDAEGSEPLILRGMRKTIRDHYPVFYLEVNELSLAAAGRTALDIEDVLVPFGYKFWSVNWRRNGWRAGSACRFIEHLASETRDTCTDIIALAPRREPMWSRALRHLNLVDEAASREG